MVVSVLLESRDRWLSASRWRVLTMFLKVTHRLQRFMFQRRQDTALQFEPTHSTQFASRLQLFLFEARKCFRQSHKGDTTNTGDEIAKVPFCSVFSDMWKTVDLNERSEVASSCSL